MIGYYVHHQGQGHRRRATAVARELRVPVTGLGTGDAPEGWPGEWVSLAPDDDPEVKDPEYADVTAGDVLHWVPRHHPGLLERHRQIVEWLTTERPSLVVVDVSVEVTLLVRLCGIPVVVGRQRDPLARPPLGRVPGAQPGDRHPQLARDGGRPPSVPLPLVVDVVADHETPSVCRGAGLGGRGSRSGCPVPGPGDRTPTVSSYTRT